MVRVLAALLLLVLLLGAATAHAAEEGEEAILAEIARALSEPYKHGYARDRIVELVEDANSLLEKGPAQGELQQILDEAEKIHEEYLEHKPLLQLRYALNLALPAVTAATVYYGVPRASKALSRAIAAIRRVLCGE